MTGASALHALKSGLRAHLNAHAPLFMSLPGGIHDAPPRETAPAYLVIGDGIARENGSIDGPATIVELDIAIHTRERGTAEALAIAALIESRLATPPVLTGARLVLLVIRETGVRHDPARSLTRGLMRLRAFIEPALIDRLDI